MLLNMAVKNLPYFLSSILVLLISFLLAWLIYRSARRVSSLDVSRSLLASALSKVIASLILIIGFYLSLKTAGLSGLAATVLGGTGLMGLIMGFALKGPFENYVSGLMISLKDIFRKGEYVQVGDFEGIIQSVTNRGTTLMDFDGNSIILSNSMVVNSPIKNFTRNPKMRLSFDVGIGYEEDIDRVKTLLFDHLVSHTDNIILEPLPTVFATNLGSATVTLRVAFWIDSTLVSQFKVRAWAIQSCKELLVEARVSLPDDAREIVFTSPLEIRSSQAIHSQTDSNNAGPSGPVPITARSKVSHGPNRGPTEIEELKKQVLDTEPPEKGNSII